MAYTETKLTNLGHLKDLAELFAAENAKNVNVIESVKVNGVALEIAEKAVDILIATGATNGTLAVNSVDVAVKGLAALAYKAQVSESDLDTALQAVVANVGTLTGSDTGKSVRTIANEELAAQLIPEGAKESLDTLTEIAAWIQEHPDDAAAMNAAISKLNSIVAGIGGDEDDYATVLAAIEGKITAAMAGITAGATKVEASETNGNIKINGTETTVYTHPTTTATEAAFVKVGKDANGHTVLGDAITKSDITALGIPEQDTTYAEATTEAAGLLSAADKTKLDGMAIATDEEVEEMLNEVFPTA